MTPNNTQQIDLDKWLATEVMGWNKRQSFSGSGIEFDSYVDDGNINKGAVYNFHPTTNQDDSGWVWRSYSLA
jgi:hypothetical protein